MTCASSATPAAAVSEGPSFQEMLDGAREWVEERPASAEPTSDSGALSSLCSLVPNFVTPRDVAFALRYQPPADEVAVYAPPPPPPPVKKRFIPGDTVISLATKVALPQPMSWQVEIRSIPLPTPPERFDTFRSRLERLQPVRTTLDVRVTAGNNREVERMPVRMLWRGPMNGTRIANCLRKVLAGHIGWTELDEFVSLARPQLDRLTARWNGRRTSASLRLRIAGALGRLSSALQAVEQALQQKDLSALAEAESTVLQADEALMAARRPVAQPVAVRRVSYPVARPAVRA